MLQAKERMGFWTCISTADAEKASGRTARIRFFRPGWQDGPDDGEPGGYAVVSIGGLEGMSFDGGATIQWRCRRGDSLFSKISREAGKLGVSLR